MQRIFLWMRQDVTVDSPTGSWAGMVLVALILALTVSSSKDMIAGFVVIGGISFLVDTKMYKWVFLGRSIGSSKRDNLASFH